MTTLPFDIDPGEQYRAAKPFLADALEYFREEVRKLIAGKVSDQYVTGRVKSARSLIRKLREDPSQPRSWESIRDKVGLRVICSTLSDCRRVDELIQGTPWVLLDRKVMDGEPKELFYPGTHLIVQSESVCDYEGKPIPCEIQVRTRAQDAWSVVSHKLSYKEDVKPPKVMERMIQRLTVIVEMFDDDVQRVFDERRKMEIFRSAVALECIDLQYETLTGDISEGFPDVAIIELILKAYSAEELPVFERLIEDFCEKHASQVSHLILSHTPESNTYVDSRDWLYSQPEILPILERAASKPYLLLNAVKDTDLEDVVRKCCISAGSPLPS